MILIRPVLLALYKRYPNVRVTILSNKNFKTLFDFDNRIRFVGVDFNSKEGKTLNLINKVRRLNKESKFNFIYDLHDVIESELLEIYFTPKLFVFLIRAELKKGTYFKKGKD